MEPPEPIVRVFSLKQAYYWAKFLTPGNCDDRDRNLMLACRIRPFSDAENAIKERRKVSYIVDSTGKILTFGTGERAQHFNFDSVLDQKSTQENVAELLPHVLLDAVVIAYGQTGSGKTYTMTGDIWKSGGILWAYFKSLAENWGRGFDWAKLTMIQLYHSELKDLLRRPLEDPYRTITIETR